MERVLLKTKMPNSPVSDEVLDTLGKDLIGQIKEALEKARPNLSYKIDLNYANSVYKNSAQISNEFFLTLQFFCVQSPSMKTEKDSKAPISIKQIFGRKLKSKGKTK